MNILDSDYISFVKKTRLFLFESSAELGYRGAYLVTVVGVGQPLVVFDVGKVTENDLIGPYARRIVETGVLVCGLGSTEGGLGGGSDQFSKFVAVFGLVQAAGLRNVYGSDDHFCKSLFPGDGRTA